MPIEKRSVNGEKRFVWMQLLGFEKTDPDKGVARYLEQLGFAPYGICALMYHPDIVHHHRGMEEEYVLYKDNCAYYGIPRNVERERQEWTNYDLRDLCHNMKKAGSGLYMSMFGCYIDNTFHHEWLSDHPEVRYLDRSGPNQLNCLKRLADGRYYEDVFVEKLVQALDDYGFEGVHLTDAFCPLCASRRDGDFSTDMVEQFLNHTGIELPAHITAEMGNDEPETVGRRGDYIWENHRAAWLRFYDWRWGVFFEKVCSRVHAIGKKVLVLGMYCTDPFESMYLMGFNLKTVFQAGVDYVMPNIVATGIYMESSCRSFFHRYMDIIPMAKAQCPEGNYLCMLGVQDASEEWDILHHAPCKLERDAYTMFSYQYQDAAGPRRAMDGLMTCLGDSMSRTDWAWLNERVDIAFDMEAAEVLSPMVVWSDTANDNHLEEYIETRRWSVHKQMYEMSKLGALFGGAVRSENIHSCHCTLFMPNFDLMAEEERRDAAAYRGGTVVCTAGPAYDPAADGLQVSYLHTDAYANYPLKVFVLNAAEEDTIRTEVEQLLAVADDREDIDPATVEDYWGLLQDDIPFRKVSEGFVQACAMLLKKVNQCPFAANVPFKAYKLSNGKYRLYAYGLHEDRYSRALITSKLPIADAKVVSKFPILPVRFIETEDTKFFFAYEKGTKHSFQMKMQPSGNTIVDVTVE